MKSYRNIIIVRTDRIGDVILTMPVVTVLRKTYPQARLTMLVSPLTYPLVEKHPDLNEVIVDDRAGRCRGPRGFFRLAAELRRKKFDLALVLHTKKRTNSLCFFAGIPARVGYYNNKFGFFLTRKIKDTRHEGLKHEAEYCLDVLRVLDIPVTDEDFYVSVSDQGEQWADKFLQEYQIQKDKFVVIHPGASDPAKQWPVENFRALIAVMLEIHPFPVCMIGTAANKPVAGRIVEGFQGRVMDLTGQTSVAQMISLLKRARLLVSNDSGPVHIATALGTPVVSIFTRNQPGINPERWKPLGEKGIAISPPARSPVSLRGGATQPLPVSKVLNAVETLL